MKSATIAELKKELEHLEPQRVAELTLRLARFKKENKELLTYLMYESHDLPGFIRQVKEEMDQEFLTMNRDTLYLAKKSLRKILRITGKYVRYAGSKEAEVELLIHFIGNIHRTNIPYRGGAVISNLYDTQVKKIGKLIALLDEDLQHDWTTELEKVTGQ
ncbi:MAG TPA: hypothetical protein VK826_17770 [Bacteroidia bacterium]|nr:hypothetical protein [Bacteroidia bacterium]